MLRKACLVASIVLLPCVAFAAPNVGGCGWGSKLMAGNEGIAPQVLAVTTNGTSGSQTFGITSGTSGCTQSGVVQTNWKTAMFVGNNMNKLARDMSVGKGESLDSLASLLNVQEKDKPLFNQTAQANFSVIFPNAQVTSEQVMASLKGVLMANDSLAAYAAQL